MKMRGYVSIFSVAVIAVLSAFFLWRIMVDQSQLGQLGLVGVFLASMLSHLTVVARDMFVPVFLPLTSTYSPFLLGAVAGWGGAIGEVTTYFLGWGVAESIQGNQSETENRIAGWINRYGLLAVLLVSLTPLPDTPIVLLAGSSRLSFKKLFIVEGVGKTALYTLGAFIGGIVFGGLTEKFGGIAASALMVAVSVAFCILVTWSKSRDAIFGLVERILL